MKGAYNNLGKYYVEKRLILCSKTRSTYYTEEKVGAARSNIKKYGWAKEICDAVLVEADKYVNLDDEFLWELVTPQSIPRSYAVNQTLGCLNCGKQIDKYGNYPYLNDPIKDPWRLECPNCHTKFPTNDFASYYKSGKNEGGKFDPRRANKRLLINTLYPERGEAWGVDDGYGYITPKGDKYTFIAYYNHWGLWYKGALLKALNALRDAYIYTGDARYSRKGIILLDRIADFYPSMDISQFDKSLGFLNSDGGTNNGKIVGAIWETFLTKDFIRAYDAFFSCIDDSEAIHFLKAKSTEAKNSIIKKGSAEIKDNIENGIIRQIYPSIRKGQIKGNNGMHQSTLALAAIILDSLPETKEWIDFNLKSGSTFDKLVTGGNIMATLVDDVDRDGNGNEASPQYNRLWLNEYIEIAKVLKDYKLYPSVNLFNHLKFHKMFYAMHGLILSDNYSALIGDSGSTGSPTNYLDKSQCLLAFEEYNDPIFAQLIYFLNGNTLKDIEKDIFSTSPEMLLKNIEAIITQKGALGLYSTNMTGYGFSALRDGSGRINFNKTYREKRSPGSSNNMNTQRALWLYYGKNFGHGHRDTLNLGLIAYNLDLMPELGYPEFADSTPHRTEWVTNTICHNTVVVDKSKQFNNLIGCPKAFDDNNIVKLIDVEAPKVYAGVSMYKRTLALIKIDDTSSYAVDFFRVKGGSDHHFSFHGAEGNVVTEGLSLTPQADVNGVYVGSYEGSDVEFGARPITDSIPGFGYTGGGFHWLKNVDRDLKPQELFSADWHIRDTWNVGGKGYGSETDIHLRLTMLGKMKDVSLADGVPPRNKSRNPSSLRYLIAHRQGHNLESLFTSIIEPYKKDRNILSIEKAIIKDNGVIIDNEDVRAIKIVHRNGRIDYIISSIDLAKTYQISDKFLFRGYFGVVIEKNGEQIFNYINQGHLIGDHIAACTPYLLGTIKDFTKVMSLKNEIIVDFNCDLVNEKDLIENFIYIQNDGIRNAVYRIKELKRLSNTEFILNIGDITLIRSWKEAKDFSKGYVYDISIGDKFSIPLKRVFQAPNLTTSLNIKS